MLHNSISLAKIHVDVYNAVALDHNLEVLFRILYVLGLFRRICLCLGLVDRPFRMIGG